MDPAEYDKIVEYLRRAERSKYSPAAVKARFEAEPAPSYGTGMARWIPDFDYAHQLLLDCLALYLPAGPALGVELGAGTGRVSQRLLEAFPHLHLTLVDVSPNMLAEAARRLAEQAPRCQFAVRDIFEAGLEFPANSLSCVVAVFAICHAPSPAGYEQLYQRIQRWLLPGGCFVCYDHVRGATFPLTALNALGWHRLLAASQTPEQAQDGIVGTYQEDSPLSLSEHLRLLAGAGFGAVDVLYKRDIFAIYAGIK